MIPAEGFKYSQCSFKPEEKVRIDKILSKFNERFDHIGFNFYETKDLSVLDNVPYQHIIEIVNWEKDLDLLEAISYKMAVVQEYRQLNKLVSFCKEKQKYIQETITTLEENLRKDYSKIITNNDFFSRYFSYKDFKEMFQLMFSPEKISLSKIESYKKENLFKSIRRKIISGKANLQTLLTESEKSVIHINHIKKEDLKTYQLLRTEFFTTICDESLGLKIPFGKETQTEIIRPSHPLANLFKIQKTEIVYLTVSLNPINDTNVSENTVVEFNNGMKFDVSSPQQVIEKELFYQIDLDQMSKCNLIVPFYFSFIKCNLVKEQRSNYNKINDNSLIEDISLENKKSA